MFLKKILRHELFWLVLVLFVSVLPTVPSYYFGQPVMYQCHDYIIHPARLAQVEMAIKQGVLIPNWLTGFSFGYGSPAMLFSWFLPYYPALVIRLLGASLVDSVKVVFLLSTIISGIGIYFLAKKISDKTAALAGVGFYLLSPFRLNLIFTRCSFGENFAQMFVPFIFLFMLSKRKSAPYFIAILLALLAISHFLTFMFTVGLIGLWLLFVAKDRDDRLKISLAIGGGLVLSAFYWIPSFLEQGLTYYSDVSKMWYTDQFVSFKALLNSAWQYGPPQPKSQAYSMSFQIGKIHWLVVLLLSPLLVLKKGRIAIFFLSAFIISILLQMEVTKPLWDNFHFAQIITFPWRLAAVSTFSVALLAALLVAILPWKRVVVGLVFIALLWANRNHFPTAQGSFASDSYLKNFGFNGGSYIEYMTKGSDLEDYTKKFKNQPENLPLIVNNAPLEITNSKVEPTKIIIRAKSEEDNYVIIRQYYFPGWKGSIDGYDLEIASDQGLIGLTFPKGEHELLLSFEQTVIRKITSAVSLSAWIILSLFGLWKLNCTRKCIPRKKPTGGTLPKEG